MTRNTPSFSAFVIASLSMVLLMFAAAALAGLEAPGGYDLSWNTVDGGGGTSSGGAYELSGTIGQPDAGTTMTGGAFTLAGGFWPGAGPAVNPCPADIAPSGGDGTVNAGDLLAVINSWGSCPGCTADINHDNNVNAADLLAVINAWGPCP